MSESPFKRIDTVFLPVRSLARAVEWYRTHLGWPLAWQNEGVAVFSAGSTPLTLLQHRFPGLPEAPEGEAFQPVLQVPFNFYAPDLPGARDHLLAQGVEVSEIHDYGEVQEFQLTDLDGNRLSVVHWPE